MLRKLFRKYLPSADSVRSHRLIGRFGGFLQHPNLWHLNRDSVAGGLAVGLFAGLVPGPLQMLTAAVIAIPLRVNLPLALFTTLYTNPFTIGPLYLIAYQIGKFAVGGDAHANPAPPIDWANLGAWMEAFMQWTLSLGKPLALGLVMLAAGLALLGYFAVQLSWRIHVVRAWRRRAARRAGAGRP
jgi:uncharacterized protein (DUF2062 family)